MGREHVRPGTSLLGESAAIRLVREKIRTLGPTDATVLIEGETGTGKELVARALHHASRRRAAPYVAVSAVGLTELPVASQLFGHVRGAFQGATSDRVGLFERARHGTLLLDEIGDIPPGLQPQLLRVLLERELLRVGDTAVRPIDVRVLATTHRELETAELTRLFRHDFLHRIGAGRIVVPALRSRRDDIPLLAVTFLKHAAAAHGRAISGISGDALRRLVAHAWPGNLRELASAMEWAAIGATDVIVRTADLPPDLTRELAVTRRLFAPASDSRQILDALKTSGGNRKLAARVLGISRATLYRRLAAFDARDALKS